MQKRRVIVLGATGAVGRRIVEMLVDHPFFEIEALVGSEASAGVPYRTIWEKKEQALAAHYGPQLWIPRPFPRALDRFWSRNLDDVIRTCTARIAFSSVPESACIHEQRLLAAGFNVFSNSPWGRFDAANGLVVPEVNWPAMRGKQLIKNPNCVTSGLALVLAPLKEKYGIASASVATCQSLSGRGDTKYQRELVLRNIYPLHDSDERNEDLIMREMKALIGAGMAMSIACHRVPVQEGHFADVRIRTHRRVSSVEEVAAVLRGFDPLRGMGLPLAPSPPLVVVPEAGRPRPLDDADHAGGMAVAVGGITTNDELFDLRLALVVNNIVRGAAGGAILNAEMFVSDLSMAREEVSGLSASSA